MKDFIHTVTKSGLQNRQDSKGLYVVSCGSARNPEGRRRGANEGRKD